MHNLNVPVLKPALICTIQSLHLNVKTSYSVFATSMNFTSASTSLPALWVSRRLPVNCGKLPATSGVYTYPVLTLWWNQDVKNHPQQLLLQAVTSFWGCISLNCSDRLHTSDRLHQRSYIGKVVDTFIRRLQLGNWAFYNCTSFQRLDQDGL